MKQLLLMIALVALVGCGKKSGAVPPTQGSGTDPLTAPPTASTGPIFDRADHSDGYGKEGFTVYFKKMPSQHHGFKTTDDKDPSHFEVAGSDGVWHTCDITGIVYGDHIIVKSSAVKEPIHVRMTKPNVLNESGLIVQPFSTFK